MKHSSNTLRTGLFNAARKIFFCSQLVTISLALPSLYYVGISHHNQSDENTSTKRIIITNKGKKILASEERTADNTLIKYSAAFLKI